MLYMKGRGVDEMINLVISTWLKDLKHEIVKDLMYECLLWIGLINLWLFQECLVII